MNYDAQIGNSSSTRIKFEKNRNLKFDTQITIEEILKTSDESDTGYIIECDLRFPIEIHDNL